MKGGARASNDSRGFTIIELLVVIVLASVLVVLAAPSLMEFRRSSELNAVTSALLVSVNEARSEAMKRGARAGIVPRDGNNWAAGWQVFVDADFDGVHSAGDPLVAEEALDSQGMLLIDGTGTAGDSAGKYLLFDASGYARTRDGAFSSSALTIRRMDSLRLDAARLVKVSRTGRVRSCRPDSSNCDASDE